MALISSSSTVTNNFHKPYDVFLSFRGEDTRYTITSHICTALREKKIETYFDEDSLERGNEISPALLAAIESSKISVIIISEHYATSSWCLGELVHIHKCRQNLNQFVLPIFYKVDPSNIRKQDQGSYRDAFEKYEKNPKHTAEAVQKWRSALKASADLSGLHYSPSSNRAESALVKEVVDIILKNLGRPVVSDHDDFKGLIGMRNRFKEVELLLKNNGSPKLQILGIWGMPGVGKTTIASVVGKRLSPRFESYYFLRNVREESEKHGLERLRDELISKLLGDENINCGILSNPIPEHAKDRLRRTKVLLVLDDVSERKHLEHLIGDHFGINNGSKILVTTRDERVLRGGDFKADYETYEAKLLSFKEALLLFSLTTFRENSPPPDFEDLSRKVVKYVGRNPLALTVLGSHFRSLRIPSKENWEMELEKLKKSPHKDIQKVLRISYDALDEMEQKIFLDIACFFKGTNRGFVESILNGCNFFATTGIDDLIDKSLVTVDSSNNDKVNMHDLVQQMGWQIVSQESKEPGDRSRLWIAEDACDVFISDTGTSKIEGIFLFAQSLDEDLCMEPEVFKKIISLRLLKIYGFSQYTVPKLYLEALQCFPRSLRYLDWDSFPLKSLPSSFSPRYLVQLNFPYSQLELLWNGTEKLNNLKGIDLRHSINLSRIPDLSRAQNLETLILEKCTSLTQVPWHIFGKLNKFSDLNLSHCHKLADFPESINAKELKTLSLAGCVNLKTVPKILSRSLVSLNLHSTPIVNIPSSIFSIDTISELVLGCCESLVSLPSSLSQLHLLKKLDVGGCSSLDNFPELPLNIEKLIMSNTPIKEVPSSSIEGRSFLRDLSFRSCKRLENLPNAIFELTSLASLDLSHCLNLKNLPENTGTSSNLENLCLDGSGIVGLASALQNLTNLRRLELNDCKSLQFLGGLCGSRLTYLSLRGCIKIHTISQIPFTLEYLDATRCMALKEVVITPVALIPAKTYHEAMRTFYEQRVRRFWDSRREVKHDTFDYWMLSECFRLTPNACDNILTEFQHKVLHMATRYESPSPKYKVETSPGVTVCYTGNGIPYWFNYRESADSDSSVTITLPSEWRHGDILGFALCAVSPGGQCTMASDIFCQIEFRGEGAQKDGIVLPETIAYSAFIGTTTTMVYPYSFLDQVVMWYKHCDFSNYRGGAEQVSFKFTLRDRGRGPSSYIKLASCGVHILCIDDLDDLRLIDGSRDNNLTQLGVGVDINKHQDDDQPESSGAHGVVETGSDTDDPDHLEPDENESSITDKDGHDQVDTKVDERDLIVETEQHEQNSSTEDAHDELSTSTIEQMVWSAWSKVLLCCSKGEKI